MKSFVAAILACMAGISPAIAAELEIPGLRYLRAYTGYNFTGPYSDFLDFVPDLNTYSMDNLIQSVCLTGIWIMFTETNYEGSKGEFFSGLNNCYNGNSMFPSQASSLRYAGSPYDLNDVYYNLYENDSFVGLEFKGNTDAPSVEPLDQDVSSLIITGQSPWTFFTGLDYTGLGVCVHPLFVQNGEDNIQMAYYYLSSASLLGLPDNSIRSVAKGCLSEKIVRLQPSEASLRPEGDHILTNNAH